MENHSFVKGRDSLLQTLALLKEEEEFQAEFGGFQEVMEDRRAKSVRGLCAMIGRLKTESELKKQCVDSLEDVTKWWKMIQEERGKLQGKISELEKDKRVLEGRVKTLEGEVKELKNQSAGSLYHTALRGSSEEEGDGGEGASDESHNEENQSEIPSGEDFEEEGESQVNSNLQQRHSFYTTRFDESKGLLPPADSKSSSAAATQKPNFSYPLLNGNPYEQLDRDYYNPTQFFQRQSSTFRQASKGARGRGGRRGGGAKRKTGNTSSSGGNSGIGGNKKPKRGSGEALKSCGSDEKKETAEGNEGEVNRSEMKGDEEAKDVPEDDSSFFDYTSAFVDDGSDYLPDIH